jgi:hypothetical protein
MDEWRILEPEEKLEISPDSYEIVVTPDGQAHKRWGWESLSKEEWSIKTQELLKKHSNCIGIEILVNI